MTKVAQLGDNSLNKTAEGSLCLRILLYFSLKVISVAKPTVGQRKLVQNREN
jgi:hypothetical protein